MGFKFLHLFDRSIDTKDKARQKEVNGSMRKDFLNSISFEEDPFEGEIPENVRMFDLDGNEVES